MNSLYVYSSSSAWEEMAERKLLVGEGTVLMPR